MSQLPEKTHRAAPALLGRVLAVMGGDGKPRSLRQISRRMERSRPVFIVGEARSGTTILFRTLLKHPAFQPRVENLQESSFIVQAPEAADFTETSPRNLRRFLLDDEQEWESFLESLQPVHRWLRVVNRLGPTFVWRWSLGPSKLVARSFAFHAQRARACRRLVEKTPTHVNHIERLLACFPAARILYIHRHPVDVYSSYVRRAQVNPKADWARLGPDDFCDRYRTHTRRALEAARRHPESVLVIRYEHFTGLPQRELERICAFLEEPHHPHVVKELDGDPDGGAHWEGSRHLFEGIKTQTKRWSDYCSADDAALIQDELAAEMVQLGYQPYPV